MCHRQAVALNLPKYYKQIYKVSWCASVKIQTLAIMHHNRTSLKYDDQELMIQH